MHSGMWTWLAFMPVGLVLMKFLEGILYVNAGIVSTIIGAPLIIESGRQLRQREADLGHALGAIR